MKAQTLDRKLQALMAITSKPGEVEVRISVNGMPGRIISSSIYVGNKENPLPYLLLKCDCPTVREAFVKEK